MRILSFVLIILITSFRSAIAQDSAISVTQLSGDFYIYKTFGSYKGAPVPANGMYLVTNAGVVLFDTPWDSTQFQNLLDTITTRHQKKVIICIATHFHDDRSGGLEYYRQHGIKTFTTQLTDKLSAAAHKHRAEFLLTRDSVFSVGQYSFETYYPGEGHTKDNIVVWFKKQKILYGGCLVKSVEDDDLGYLGDANLHAYPATMLKLQKKCKGAKYVIPGHGAWEDVNSIAHTLQMAKEANKHQ